MIHDKPQAIATAPPIRPPSVLAWTAPIAAASATTAIPILAQDDDHAVVLRAGIDQTQREGIFDQSR